MSSRRERSGGSSREITNLTRREDIIRRNHDRARRRLQVRATMGRESVETAERTPRTDREERRFDRRRSLRDRPRIAQRRRLELIARRPERRHTDNAHFREPTVSHRIVGRDVDVNEDRMFDLLPAPDQDLHMRTWRSLNIVYTKASIVEMVTGLNREEYMEFARIIMTGLPTSSVREMRRRGMIEDIQRVLDLGNIRDFRQGYDDDFNQGYNDNGCDQSDLEDELVSNPDSENIEISSIPKQPSHRRALPDADISSDEPMDDYISTDNENNNLYGPSIPKSGDHLRLNSRSKPSRVSGSPLESLRQSDGGDEELLQEASATKIPPSISVVPPSLLSKPKYRLSSNTSTDQAQAFQETEILRFQECLATSNSMQSGKRCLKDDVLDKYAESGLLFVELFKYEPMLKSVFGILESGSFKVPAACNYESRLDMGIPSDIYRVVDQINFTVENTAQSRLREAHSFVQFNQVFETEIQRRNTLFPGSHTSSEASAVADIKFDMACAANRLSRQDLIAMKTTDLEFFKATMTRATNLRQQSMRVSAYTNSMGSPAALLIWPWLAMLEITGSHLLRLQHVFINGVSRFLKGSNEFRNIQALITHLSTWFEGWIGGSISSEEAKARLNAFLSTRCKGGPPREEPIGAQLSCSTVTHDEPENELQQLIEMFSEIPRANNATYSTVGTTGYDMSLNITDMESLGSQRQLTERAIEAVLATTKFPEGVMFARASGYGSLYDQQKYEHERSMSIHQGVKTILCPVHTGDSAQHWVGVVVRLDYKRRGRPGISALLLDSMATDTYNSVYDEKVIKKIVVTWLRHRLPDFKSFPTIGELVRPRVEQQVDLNSCGVHMLLNLRAAGLDGKYISKGRNCTSKGWIDDAREFFVRRILRSAGKHLGGDIQSTNNELLDESGLYRQERQTSNASASRVVSPHLGS
ncbi:hypothetical protein V495_03211 [Pseudogymnoascus sp. VKM F-4514 (FW-929)]|nr:hypothetical protein V495_03211 [Pseudogymnoascus sp. VKM F-4514 (FW-929)]KFY51246.1 hypothetical protein V497_09263 [Pseudogymnoascus sp. VKM F-4516 (FW-969)]